MNRRKIFSVSEITTQLKDLIEGTFPPLWVEGEVSNLREPSSGHIYFTLKDEKSQLRAVMFRFRRGGLKFKLDDGLKVMAYGKLGVYGTQGQYQIIVEEVEPKGIGSLQMAFEQLKKKLQTEGLFDEQHKVPIPLLPQRIGVVTSATGAAFQDILNVVRRRFSNVEIILNPAPVQGEGAGEKIARAISELDELKEVDVIIMGRGGGSLEDLWAFNEEVVARAIYACQTPVISAVGHEIDWTIADFVADVRAPTPSAAAEMVIGKKEEFLEKIEGLSTRVSSSMTGMIEKRRLVLENLMASYGFRHPTELLRQYEQRVDELAYRIESRLTNQVSFVKEKVAGLLRHLEALSPLGILQRGYSITFSLPERGVVKTFRDVSRGDKIETRLAEGKVVSKVLELEK
ncbi:MAG: exodeoxyribonuclease VII large subunit [Candidatus Omnitrophica bacterium]|nr:exodeoxyribonuclease VII large subunit [Candidatus Omnitrophota bacterium]